MTGTQMRQALLTRWGRGDAAHNPDTSASPSHPAPPASEWLRGGAGHEPRMHAATGIDHGGGGGGGVRRRAAHRSLAELSAAPCAVIRNGQVRRKTEQGIPRRVEPVPRSISEECRARLLQGAPAGARRFAACSAGLYEGSPPNTAPGPGDGPECLGELTREACVSRLRRSGHGGDGGGHGANPGAY
eukprot:362542-Chlamydomonas_euryale.AAC.3